MNLSTGGEVLGGEGRSTFSQKTRRLPLLIYSARYRITEEYNIHVKSTVNPKEICTMSR